MARDFDVSSLVDIHGRPLRFDGERHADDGMALPHVVTSAAIFQGASRTYLHQWDEAMRAGRDLAMAMRRDAWLMALLHERYDATAGLKWHLEADNPRDPWQRAVQDGLQQIVRRTPHLRDLFWYLLDAVWYGRYAAQVEWKWDRMLLPKPGVASSAVPGSSGAGQPEWQKVLRVNRHLPVNGDKIGHHHDHTPFVLVNSSYADQLKNAELSQSTLGRCLTLSGTWRDRFIISRHIVTDADFFDAEMAEQVHGLGLRSLLYFNWWMASEQYSWITDALERTGLGVIVVEYDASNSAAEAKAKDIARTLNRNSIVVIAATKNGSEKAGSVRVVEGPTAGAQFVKLLRDQLRDDMERLVIGQSLSSGTEGSGLGGTGVAALHAKTKFLRCSADAKKLQETLTGSDREPGLISLIKKFTYPWADFDVRFVFDLEDPEAERKLGAITEFINVGGDVNKDEARGLVGVSKPSEGDDVLSLQNMQAMMPQQGTPGMPGGAPPPNGEPDGGEPDLGLLGGLEASGQEQGGAGGNGAARFGRSGTPARYQVGDVPAAVEGIHPEPSDGQVRAKNWKMGHVGLHGLDLTLEVPKGGTRVRIDGEGKRRLTFMNAHYGYLKRTRGADGEHVDVYLGDDPESEIVFVVNQLKADGSFDEHKCCLGYTSAKDARAAYLSHFPRGWKVGDVVPMTLPQFKRWLSSAAWGPATEKR